jgi:3-deoxy-manno-octulosonate cytidylyltransferase (CMP-KDO synthetase)
MKVIGIIPARLKSSRLPRKLLLQETGKPLLQYAWEAACRSERLSEVIIATDSDEIARVAVAFGARVEMTGEHPSGSDRLAEVVQRVGDDADLVVNVQGDEPELDPRMIDRLVERMSEQPRFEMGTLACPIQSEAVLEDRGCVKVVTAADGRALYFSRLPIPCYRDGHPAELFGTPRGDSSGGAAAAYLHSPWLLHIGLYAYRPEFLLAFTRMPPSRLEQLEQLEQLRALEAGAAILVEVVSHRTVGIDTAADYAAFVERERCRRGE